MPGRGWRCDEIFLSDADGDKTDPPRNNDACFAGQTHGMFGRRKWAGRAVDAHPERLAAALYHGSDTGVFLDVGGVSPARSVRTKYSKQTGSQLFSSPRKTFEEEMIRMRFEKFPDLLIKLADSLIELTQLR